MTTRPRGEPADRYGRAWWAGLAVGGAVLAYGVGGLLVNAMATVPPAWAAWLAATLLVHDLVVLPVVFAAGRLLRLLPGTWWRAPVGSALALSGVAVVTTLPAFLGDGRGTQPGNASVLPNDYGRSLLLVLSLVWTVAAGWALVRGLRSRRSAPRPPSQDRHRAPGP